MSRKLFLSILAAGSTTGVALYSFPKSPKAEGEPNLVPSSSTDPDNVIKIGDVSKTLQEVLKEYLKTVTGARTLSNFLAASLAVDFVESRSHTSSPLGDRLKNELTSLKNTHNLDSLPEEEKKKAQFEFGEDSDLYRRHHVLSNILKKFPEILSDSLKDSIKDSSLNNSDSTDQTLGDLGQFLDHVLDDYIEMEKPIFVKRISWKYGTSGMESQIKALFDENALPKGITLPTTGNYFFPLFSEDTESKFSKFIKALSASSTDFSNFSDESTISHIFSLSSTGSSQQTIALLELMGHAMTFERWKESDKGTTSDNLSTKFSGTHKNICGNGNSQKIPTISFEDLSSDETNNKLSRVFCVEKNHNPFSTSNIPSDFFYLKKKNETENKPNGWIVFKDIHGVHAMSLDLELGNDDLKTATKKKLLSAAKGSDSGHQWNINSLLGSHLRKHFVRLFLEKYEEISKKIETNGKTEFNEISSKLVEVLRADLHTESLRSLRYKIFSDFQGNTSLKPADVGGTFKYINPSLGWAGKLPHKPGDKFLRESEPKFKDHKLVFDYYENIFLADFKKLTEDNISINSKFSKQADPSNFKDKIDSLFTSVASSKSDKGNFYSINKDTPSSSETKFKNLATSPLLNLIWVSGLRDGSIIDHLIQTQIKDSSHGKLTFYDWNDSGKQFKDSGTIEGNTSESLFDSQNNGETLFKSIIKNHLLSKYLGKFIDSPDIHVDAPDGTIDLSTLTNPDALLTLLKKIDEHQRKVFSSTFHDLISPSSKEMFTELLTLRHLSSNKLNHFRKYLRKKMSRTNLSGFIFSRKFESNGLCRPHTDKPTENDAKNLKMELGKSWDLNNKYLGYTENSLNTFNCIPKSDLFNFSSAKLPKDDGSGKADSFTNLAGHRGLYSENMKDILPQEIVDLISGKTMAWKSGESLKKHILSLKTEEELNALIKRLKTRFPDIDWTIVEKDSIIEGGPISYNWRSWLASKIEEKGAKISFENRRKILLNFLLQNNGDLHNPNHSRKTLRQRQQKLLQDDPQGREIQLFNTSLFNRHYGWVTGKDGSHLIEDSNKNKHSIFFIQLKYDDLEDEDSWTSFLGEMPTDLIVKELIRASKDKDAQRLALTHHLMEDKNPMDGFTVHEERIREKLDFGWIIK